MVLGMLGGAVAFSYCLLGRAPDFVRSSLSGEQYTAFQGNDPTYEFLAPQGKHSPFSATPLPHALSDLVTQGLRLQGALFHAPLGALAALGVLLIIGSLCLTRKQTESAKRRYTEPALAALGCICAIALITILSDRTFSIWVYQTEALRRIVPYCSLFLTWWLFLSLEYVATSVRRGLLQLINFGTWCLTIIFFTLSIPLTQPIHSPFRLSTDGFLALKQFENSPAAHILATEISTGAFHTLTDSHALLEGHQPVLRPTMIIKTLNLIEEARAFFRDPITNSGILNRYKITHVVVTTASQGEFGGTRLLPAADVSLELAKLAELCNSRSIRNIKIFEVCNQDLNAKSHSAALVD